MHQGTKVSIFQNHHSGAHDRSRRIRVLSGAPNAPVFSRIFETYQLVTHSMSVQLVPIFFSPLVLVSQGSITRRPLHCFLYYPNVIRRIWGIPSVGFLGSQGSEMVAIFKTLA
jgi:hypothetical protein